MSSIENLSVLKKAPNIAIVGAVGVILAVAAYVALTLDNSGSVTSPVPSTFSVNGKTYVFTYTATNNAQRDAGLMNKRVTNTTIMLFAFPSMGTYQFWMYDTNTSLDMIWITATGSTGRVVYVYADAQPCLTPVPISCPTYGSSSPANYVIEAKAGFAEANGIVVGTQLQFT